MEAQRSIFLLVLLLFIIFTPDQTPRRHPRFRVNHLNLEKQKDLAVLANSTFGDFDGEQRWLNLTGFREGDGYQWGLLAKARERSEEQWMDSLQTAGGQLPFYEKVTGEVRGKWNRSSLSSTTHPPINLTALNPQKEYLSHFWQRNITEDEGDITITLHDDVETHESPREIRADVELYSDSSPGNGWQLTLKGVHFPGGKAILSSASTKFNAFPALPHFTTSQYSFEQASFVMNKTVTKVWNRRIEMEPDLFGVPHCELIVFLQPRPIVPAGSIQYVHQVEAELDSPEGAPIGDHLPLSYSAVVLSPDCGYVLEAPALYGPKVEAFSRLAGRLLFAFITILCLQVFLIKRQMEQASTPSTRARISYQGIVIAALGDGLTLLAMIALLTLDEVSYLSVAAAAYISLIHVMFLEVKFVFDIWTVQVGDPMRAEADRQRRANPPPPAPPPPPQQAPEPSPSDLLPLPVTAPRFTDATAMPLIVASDGTLDEPPSTGASFAAIYSRFYFTLVILMFISLWASTWPRPLRSFYTNTLAIFYFSLWWPQIYRNTMRNCRKALSWEYVIGSSILRVLPVLYWYIAPRNILAIDTNPTTALLLASWMALQVLILASQQFLGPRLLVKDSWCPPAYEYHPLLYSSSSEDDLEAAGGGAAVGGGGMSIALLASASEAKGLDDKSRKVFDCAICMNEIDVPVLSANPAPVQGKSKAERDAQRRRRRSLQSTSTASSWLQQRKYMVTPCRHIFHTECLEGWMDLRLVCPVCREELPAL